MIGKHHVPLTYGLVAVAVPVVLILMAASIRWLPAPKGSGRVASFRLSAAEWIRDTEEVAFHWNWRLLGAVSYLLADIAVLWVCIRALGFSAPIFALVVGYQVGYLANLIPIPGGVRRCSEGGLVGALLLFGLPTEPTAAAVIIYHAIALWVPTVWGTVEFTRLRKTLASGEIPPEVLAARAQDALAAQASAR